MGNIREFLYKNGWKWVRRSGETDANVRPHDGKISSHETGGAQNPTGGGGFSLDLVRKIIPETNPDPMRRTISRMPTKWERRFRNTRDFIIRAAHTIRDVAYHLWDLRWWREKTPQEIEREREIERRKKMAAKYHKEGILYAKRISNSYARLGHCYVPPKTERSFLNNTRKVRFSYIVGEPNAIWLKIDVPTLPSGVDLMKLVNDEGVLSNVAASCGHHVEAVYHVEKGAWLCVERGRGTRGIPNKVDYKKLMELMPKQRDNLTVPFGEARNSKRIYRSLEPFPHMLVGGATGNGKTNYLNMILCSLIQRNNPHDLKLVVVDLKNGIEFDAYRGLPHLWEIPDVAPDGIVGRYDRVLPLLRFLIKEGERRLKVFKKAGVTKIEDYNKHRRHDRMGRILIVFDEWARVSQRSDGKEANELLSDITATFRAVGYHVIVATQTPKTKVIPTLIKTNLSARLAFGVPSNPESLVILDNGNARGLQPPGRAIFKFGMTEVEVQTPLVDHNTVKRIVQEAVKSGGKVDNKERLSMEDIMRYSLKHLGGSMAVRPLFDHFQSMIGHNQLAEWLKQYDEKVVNIEGVGYRVVPSRGPKPRRLEKFPAESPPDTPDREQSEV